MNENQDFEINIIFALLDDRIIALSERILGAFGRYRITMLSLKVLEENHMGLFGNSRKNKEKWASIVMPEAKAGAEIDEKLLEEATALYVSQHSRILYDSIRLVMTSKNKETRKSRYQLAQTHIGALLRVKKYGNREQKQEISKALDDFVKMEDYYKHPNREALREKAAMKQKKKDEFWEAYGTMEMIDIFLGDDD